MKKINVLLADDDRDDRLFFENALKKLSIPTNFTTVADGDQLMEYLNNNLSEKDLIDVIFLDINMPSKNGFECLSEIKKNEKLKDIPVVMFSTSSSPDDMKKGFNTGANVYIRKPSDFSQLIQVIHHALPIAAEKHFQETKQENKQLKYILNA